MDTSPSSDDQLILKPQRVTAAPTLFQQSLGELLSSAGISHESALKWKSLGWISFDVNPGGHYDEHHFHEFKFIKSLVDSGLGEIMIQHLLARLERPYSYDAKSIAYSFERAAWVRVYENPGIDDLDQSQAIEVVETCWESWIDALAESGERRSLQEIADRVSAALDSLTADDTNGDVKS